MNERIRQLAEQARIKDHWSIDEARYLTNYLDEKKFAQLIIGECLAVAKYHTPDTEECEHTWLIHDKIKEHFGVEE